MKDTIGFLLLFVLLNLPFAAALSQEVVKYDRATWSHRQNREEFARIFSGRTDKAIANMRAYLSKHPDDPESLFGKNDSYGGSDKFLPVWKTSVLKIYKENAINPYYAGGESQPGTWYNFSAGDVDFFMLDTRYYRAPSFADDTTEITNMLGKEQMEWLKEKLKESEADFKVIVSSVPWSDGAKDVMAGRFDTWRGYKTERQEIFDFLTQNHISGVVLLSADRHRHDAWKHERGDDYPLYEFTSSNLTNIHYHELRKGALFGYNEKSGFGVLEFNTKAKQPYVVFKIVNIDNELIDQIRIYLHQLK